MSRARKARDPGPIDLTGAKVLGVVLPATATTAGPWTVVLDGWNPPTTNVLMRGHWAKRAGIKKAAVNRVAQACRDAGVAVAAGRRRVTITVEFTNASHQPDPDNVPKAVLDGCKRAAALIDDSAQWLDCPTPAVVRGPAKRTTVVIEDLP